MNMEPSITPIQKAAKAFTSGVATISIIIGFLLFILGFLTLRSITNLSFDPWNLNIPGEFIFGLCSMFISLPIIFFSVIIRIVYFIDSNNKLH